MDLTLEVIAINSWNRLAISFRTPAGSYKFRGLGRTHIFPGDDVGARNQLCSWLRLSKPMNYDKVHKSLRQWDAYGRLIYFHLLLKSLTEKGIIRK